MTIWWDLKIYLLASKQLECTALHLWVMVPPKLPSVPDVPTPPSTKLTQILNKQVGYLQCHWSLCHHTLSRKLLPTPQVRMEAVILDLSRTRPQRLRKRGLLCSTENAGSYSATWPVQIAFCFLKSKEPSPSWKKTLTCCLLLVALRHKPSTTSSRWIPRAWSFKVFLSSYQLSKLLIWEFSRTKKKSWCFWQVRAVLCFLKLQLFL